MVKRVHIDSGKHDQTCRPSCTRLGLQVLSTDIDHNSPSLLLFLDKEGRLLFNAGEGLQRLFRESKLRMQKVRSCF
jgi:hypothetical protein